MMVVGPFSIEPLYDGNKHRTPVMKLHLSVTSWNKRLDWLYFAYDTIHLRAFFSMIFLFPFFSKIGEKTFVF